MNTQNLHDFYTRTTTAFSNTIVFPQDQMTFQQAYDRARARAAFLQQKGFKKGDVVALLSRNSAEWVITYLAVTMTGCIVSIFDTNLTNDLYEDMLKQAGAKGIFYSKEFEHAFPGVQGFPTDLDTSSAEPSAFIVDTTVGPQDVSTLLFTSGTTSTPKIVGLTHANIILTAESAIKQMHFDPSHTAMALLPLYHVYGLIAAFIAPYGAGAKLVFQTSLKGTDIMKTMQTYKITYVPAVPQLWEIIFNRIAGKLKSDSTLRYNVFMFFIVNAPQLRAMGLSWLLKKVFKPIHDLFGGHVRLMISGGARLKRKYFRYYNNMGFTFLEGYGLSETTAVFCVSPMESRRAGSVGKALPGNEIDIRNINIEDGVGEIWARGVSIFPGYYKNPEATAAAFDANGWFNTGDVGYLDKHHNLYITGRKKNVIVLDSGKNVYPEDIEAYYQTSSDEIAEITVFGQQIEGKETLYAVIVPVNKTKDSYAHIKKEMKRLNHGLPTYKIITNFAISFDSLPITSTKKVILREVLRKLKQGIYQTAENDPNFSVKEVQATTPEMEQILVIMKKKIKTDVFYVNESLKDFDIDSLQLVELISYLENTLGISIDADAFIKAENIQALAEYLASCPKKNGDTISEQILNGKIKTRPTEFFNPLLELGLLIVNFISHIFWRIKIVNSEKLLSIDNEIIVANHQCYFDAAWIANAMPYRKRKDVYIASKKELLFMNFFFPGTRIIPVERKGNFIPALKASADLLRQGKTLIIFPEGTRTATGNMGEFKNSVAFLAKNLQKKIIPVTINGGFDAYPRNRWFPRLLSLTQVSITVHDRIDPDTFATQEEINKAMYAAIKGSLNVKHE